MNNRALIAMSGGVDSAVAAYLMLESEYDCMGATMKLFNKADAVFAADVPADGTEGIQDAAAICERLNIPFSIIDYTEGFRENVIEPFVCAYESGATPNPCLDCNREMKFGRLLECADEKGADIIVTGHYARTEYDEESGRYRLLKAKDISKDQSYVLYQLTQDQLRRVRFPLGNMTKEEVRGLALANNFINARRHDSQDICFIPDGDYAAFIERYTGKKYPEGDFVDKSGKKLGTHKGIIRYTTGQRRGLGLALPAPLYVCDKDIEGNRVVLCSNDELFSDELTANRVNLISVAKITGEVRVNARIRYSHKEQPASVIMKDDRMYVKFDEPQRAITKGQAVVLYDGNCVVGGGRIV